MGLECVFCSVNQPLGKCREITLSQPYTLFLSEQNTIFKLYIVIIIFLL